MTNHHFLEQNHQQDPDPMAILASAVGSRPPPPSYKLDTHMDLEAVERELQQSVQSYHKKRAKSIWRHQCRGTPLVFWLVMFVLMGTVSLFIPSHLPLVVAFSLWLPLLLYLMGLLIIHAASTRKKAHSRALQEMECQLAAIQQRRHHLLTQISEPPADLYFLYATSDHSTVITLLPPPPSYQRIPV